jgi:hypothetical protein
MVDGGNGATVVVVVAVAMVGVAVGGAVDGGARDDGCVVNDTGDKVALVGGGELGVAANLVGVAVIIGAFSGVFVVVVALDGTMGTTIGAVVVVPLKGVVLLLLLLLLWSVALVPVVVVAVALSLLLLLLLLADLDELPVLVLHCPLLAHSNDTNTADPTKNKTTMIPAQRRRLLTSGWVPKVGPAADPVDDTATEWCDEKPTGVVGTAARVGSEGWGRGCVASSFVRSSMECKTD